MLQQLSSYAVLVICCGDAADLIGVAAPVTGNQVEAHGMKNYEVQLIVN